MVTFTCSSSNFSSVSDLTFKFNMVGRSHQLRLVTVRSGAHGLLSQVGLLQTAHYWANVGV